MEQQEVCDYTPDPYTQGWGCQEPMGHDTEHRLGWDTKDLGLAHLRGSHRITEEQEEDFGGLGMGGYHEYLHDMEPDAH